jgi:hypothetical protein
MNICQTTKKNHSLFRLRRAKVEFALGKSSETAAGSRIFSLSQAFVANARGKGTSRRILQPFLVDQIFDRRDDFCSETCTKRRKKKLIKNETSVWTEKKKINSPKRTDSRSTSRIGLESN